MTTAQVASWVTSLDPHNIDPTVYHAGLRSLYNYLGCAVNGSAHASVQKVLVALEPLYGYHTSTILGTTQRTDAQHAALLNGIASHVHDYDDTHLATIIHPTGPVASALLAYVQHISAASGVKVNGKQFLTALIAGIEVECKLGLAVYPRHYDIGWHITSTTGAIGAAIAVSKLMGLSQCQMTNAIGNAATQAIGMRCNFGSDTKPFHAGRAAQAGFLAALLAQGGFTSDAEPLEAKRGWANVVTGGQTFNSDINLQSQLEKHINKLGQTWEISNNTFKPFPCGIVAHPAIDAAIQLRQQIIENGVLSQQDLTSKLTNLTFTVHVHPLVVELTNNQRPRTGLEAKFSVHHGIAVGLLWGKAGPAEYEDDVVGYPEVTSVREAITVVVKDGTRSDECLLEAFERGHGDNHGESTSNEQQQQQQQEAMYSVHVAHATGSLDEPMTDEMLEWKFVEQVRVRFGRQKAELMSELCWKIGDADDVNEIVNQLVP